MATLERKNSSLKQKQQQSSPLNILLQMGFPKHRAEKALAATGDRGVQLASDWLLAHVNDVTLDANMPREYILYACPTGAILDELQIMWNKSLMQCGRNGAHNYFPHVTLCSFFKAPDGSVEYLTKVLVEVVDRFREEIVEPIKLSFYTSQSFIGLFVGEDDSEVLKKLAVNYVKEVANYISAEFDCVDAFSTCFPWGSAASYGGSFRSVYRKSTTSIEPFMKSLHISLAYQFPTDQYTTLDQLSRTIDCTAQSQWELRLYSRENRINGKEVHKVLYSHIPTEDDQLELLIGDYVYVDGDQLNNTTDGWVEGTSWLTGSTGYLPKTYIEKTAESDAWTLHKSIPLSKRVELPRTMNSTSSKSPSLPQLDAAAPMPPTARKKSSPQRESTYENVEAVYAKVNKPKKDDSTGPARQLIVSRHAERVDFTFGAWIPFCFDSSGVYSQKDLNMPKTVPARKGGPQDFFKDCPLTRVGLYQAKLVGEALKENGFVVKHVYCSPSLRCVQTCSNILAGMNQSAVPTCVEPGLFEWLAWYQDSMPEWMSVQELKDAGYNVESNYRPYITAEELYDRRESSEQYYMRSYYVAQSIIKSTADDGGNILMVGHAATLDTCTRQLCRREPRGAIELAKLVHKIPYCSVAIAEESAPSFWTLTAPPFPPITHSSNSRFDWKVLLS